MMFKIMCRSLVAPVAIGFLAAFALALPVMAAEVEGQVAQVDKDARVEIHLPQGAVVAVGDAVRIWTEIPGVGLAAISTGWTVDSIEGLTVFATPAEPPNGMPQAGYIAKIETNATVNTPVNAPDVNASDANASPDTAVLDAPFSPEALTFYLRAEDLAASDDPSDQILTADAYAQAAVMRHAGAMSELGALYSFGRGVERNDKAAMDWQYNAAKLGNSKAMLRLALIHLTGWRAAMDESLGAEWMLKAAKLGNARAMYLLGMLYEDGVGVPQSMQNMVHWLERAAKAGHLDAMFVLGHIYLDGEDGIIPKDVIKTEDHWLLAAQSGHVGAMKALAEFYEGESLNAADHWTKAARAAPDQSDKMDDPLCLNAWECYRPDQQGAGAPSKPEPEREYRFATNVEECDRLAASPRDPDRPNGQMSVEYAQLDAQKVIAACQNDIAQWPDTGRFYAQLARGYHKANRLDEAFDAAMKGAGLGSGQAMAFVGIMHKAGMSVPQNAHEGLKWFEKAGFEGNVSAMHFAAGMHLTGEEVPYNPTAAAEWYQAAADLGSAEAMAELGILYDNGQGVPYNPDESAANLVAGLAMGSDKAKTALLENFSSLSPHTRISVQKILRSDGRYHGALDGVFGPQTFDALRAKIMN